MKKFQSFLILVSLIVLGTLQTNASDKKSKMSPVASENITARNTSSNGRVNIYRDASVKDLKALAAAEEKPILIYVNDPSCNDCHTMDSVLSSTALGSYLNKNFIVKNLDASKYSNLYKATNWGVKTVPSYVFMNAKGEVVHLTEGLYEPNKMMTELTNVFKKMTDSNNKFLK